MSENEDLTNECNRLAEVIREGFGSHLALSTQFRDAYGQYAMFVQDIAERSAEGVAGADTEQECSPSE
jgi:hypothetical protein